ncbi:hypothetical protein GIS00_25630 [Nakamurella sp. YIM 132087]|uniref:Fructose-bisphosphate aldolase n=1 Tax=Nakamurella alba TaxID=2665158 RepID=A0A7K1FT36_9ACTN|nr:glycoside hydrolase family 76 protein [Nakamurella alba]MTD17317.1 hypothetical protein [Nakamurella alba]
MSGFAALAAQAERTVLSRSVRRLWALPGTALGVVGDPPTVRERLFLRWHFWWQAHLLDCLVDAYLRAPDRARADRIRRVGRTILLRNNGPLNAYHDDIAWLGLALQRSPVPIPGRRTAIRRIVARLVQGWEADGGGIAWRIGDDYRNAPANGPAALLLARAGVRRRAGEMTDWLFDSLQLPSGLIADGLRHGVVNAAEIYTYCQGVALGAALAGPTGELRTARVHGLVRAIATELAPTGVLPADGTGDAGLFRGILARYLAAAARYPTGAGAAARETADLARALVLATAATVDPDPTHPERDLSVHLSDWMLAEAAAILAR